MEGFPVRHGSGEQPAQRPPERQADVEKMAKVFKILAEDERRQEKGPGKTKAKGRIALSG